MKYRLTTIIFFPILLLCLLLTRSKFVFAQLEVSTGSAQVENSNNPGLNDISGENVEVLNTSGVTEARPLVLDQERAQIKQQYRAAAEAYQLSHREYTLAKAQFQKLGTLAALEEAVLKTRQALLDRNRLLMIFFDLIHLELRASAGVDPDRKQDALRKIENFQSELRAQQQLIQNSQDRVALVARVQWFLETAEKLKSQGFYVRALILTGRLYVGYQQAMSLYEETKAFHQSQVVDSFMTAQRQRAYSEVEAQINLINAQWLKIQELLIDDANQSQVQEQNRDQNWFQRILPLLSAQQTNLIRLYAFVEELARK